MGRSSLKSTMRTVHCHGIPGGSYQSKQDGESRLAGKRRGYGCGDYRAGNRGRAEDNPQNGEIPAKDTSRPATEGNEPEGIKAAYNVTGVRRKQLVTAVGDFIGAKPEYLRAPTYASADSHALHELSHLSNLVYGIQM